MLTDKDIKKLSTVLATKQDLKKIGKEVVGIKQDVSLLKKDVIGIKHDILATKADISEIRREVTEIKKDVNDIRETVQGLLSAVDKLVQAMHELKLEYTSMGYQMTRHEKWIKEIANKVGVKLVS